MIILQSVDLNQSGVHLLVLLYRYLIIFHFMVIFKKVVVSFSSIIRCFYGLVSNKREIKICGFKT